MSVSRRFDPENSYVAWPLRRKSHPGSRPGRLGYDYYVVDLPADVTYPGIDQIEDMDAHYLKRCLEERGQIAIREAEERSSLYHMPCVWEVLFDNGNTVLVRRTFNKGGAK